MDAQLKKEIEAYALQNAVKFNGKANPGAIIGKVISTHPELKKELGTLGKEISGIVMEVNKLGLEKVEAAIKKIDPKFIIEEKKAPDKKELKELKDAVEGKVVMRFEPSPSGPMHLGHAYAISINSEYVRKYKGKLILRIADTNPENIYEPAYKLLPTDASWVTKDNVSDVVVQSKRLGLYYDYAEKLVGMGKAYVCECDSDAFRELVTKKEACPCRELPIAEHQTRYSKMFSTYKAGECVLRLKTDITHKNPAMRDFPLMRVNEHNHPKTGTEHRVWPLMNLAVFVDDVELKMTHVIRGKDHMDNARRQEIMYEYFGLKPPETVFVGKINFEGLPMSCSKVRLLIEEGKYTGWDDIRLPFLLALKRRGYQAEAFIKYSMEIGVTQTDKTVSGEEFYKSLNFFNKEVIDSTSNRYFFVKNPVKVVIKDAPEQMVKLDLHPDDSKRGHREFKTNDTFYVDKEDLDSFEDGELIRLMDCLNFVKKGDSFVFDSLDYEKFKSKGKKIIHWLPGNELIEAAVLMPDNTTTVGYCEESVRLLKEGSVVQFERFGFCRLDNKQNLTFWFGHK